jgi:hypothetical protein
MIESERKIKDLTEKMGSKNIEVISDTIISLRNENPFKGAIGILVDAYNNSGDTQVKALISNFLNDIKEKGARTEVISELKKNYSDDTLTMLVCSCWQSGLDYADYAYDFAKLLIKGDFLTALECFTVIEESSVNISGPNKKKIIGLLEISIESFTTEKAKLTRALIAILK